MNFFEYQVTIAKIDSTNSYQSLRKLHKKLVDDYLDNTFYSIHAINKIIKKFKSLTSSNIVKSKDYDEGTTSTYFNYALQSATTKEQILLLLADFQGTKSITLPQDAKSIINMANLGITSDRITSIILISDFYSVGYDNNRRLVETNRLPINIICYLSEIADTALYSSLLNTVLDKAKHWNGSKLPDAIDTINYQITRHKEEIQALEKAKLLYEELL